MARSSYIYAIQYEEACPPIACFTVKHEACSWRKRFLADQDVSLYRYRDNPREEPEGPDYIPWPDE